MAKILDSMTTYLLREGEAGVVDDETGHKYRLSIVSGSRCLVVYSEKTKQYYLLEWNDILKMAIDSGIDKPIE